EVFEARRALSLSSQTQVSRFDSTVLCHQCCTFYGVVEFAHVSRPGIREQLIHGYLGESHKLFFVMARMLAEEMHGEQPYIPLPVAQGRQANLKRVETEKEVFA